MSYSKLFFVSVSATATVLMVFFFATNVTDRGYVRRKSEPSLQNIGPGVFLTAQLWPERVTSLSAKGVKTIVDMRPDGEEPDQPTSTDMERAAKNNGLSFYYVPVPHESIPDTAVESLREILAHGGGPIVLYCRTGRRAVRLFALSEASRLEGPGCQSILDTVKAAGFSAEDLQDRITQRISQRSVIQPDKK